MDRECAQLLRHVTYRPIVHVVVTLEPRRVPDTVHSTFSFTPASIPPVQRKVRMTPEELATIADYIERSLLYDSVSILDELYGPNGWSIIVEVDNQ